MISLITVAMNTTHQWVIGLLLPIVISTGYNYGYSKFEDGQTGKMLDTIESFNLPQIKTDVALLKQKEIEQDARIDDFRSLVRDQVEISNRIFTELQKLNITTSNQEIKINGLTSDMQDFKDDFKEFKESVDK